MREVSNRGGRVYASASHARVREAHRGDLDRPTASAGSRRSTSLIRYCSSFIVVDIESELSDRDASYHDLLV